MGGGGTAMLCIGKSHTMRKILEKTLSPLRGVCDARLNIRSPTLEKH